MKDQLEIINTTFEKISSPPTGEKTNIWTFLTSICTLFSVLLFAAFYLLFLNPLGWLSMFIVALIYKFIIN